MPKQIHKRILITGGAGFIGANLASFYLNKKRQVTLLDNLYRPGVEKNINWLKKSFPSNLKISIADIRDSKKLNRAVKEKDVIFHMAGQTAVTTSVKKPREDFELNAWGTLNLLEAVRQKNPTAIIVNASTNKVYGQLPHLKITSAKTRYKTKKKITISESQPLDFHSPYGCSKGATDQYTRDYHRIYGLNTIVFRQSCIYGTHQLGVEDQGWIAHFTSSAIKNKTINIFGAGKQVRDILFIDDLLLAYDKAINNIKKTSGQIYNIGGGIRNTISLLELIALLEKISHQKIKLKFSPSRPGDQKIYISNISRAKRDFNWSPKIGVEKGITKLYFWLKKFLSQS